MLYIKGFFKRIVICLAITVLYLVGLVESLFNYFFFILRFLFLDNTFELMRITKALDDRFDKIGFLSMRGDK